MLTEQLAEALFEATADRKDRKFALMTMADLIEEQGQAGVYSKR